MNYWFLLRNQQKFSLPMLSECETQLLRNIYNICFNFAIHLLLIVLIKLFYSFKTCLKVFFASVVYWTELPALPGYQDCA